MPTGSPAHYARLIAWRSMFGLCSTIFVTDNVLEWHPVRGSSMYPTLSPDYDTNRSMDRLIFTKRDPTVNLSRGEIVSFWAPHDPEKCVVKRIIGLPGDTVSTKERHPFSSVQVPYGHIWVEGDNAARTKDSNDFGPVCIHAALVAHSSEVVHVSRYPRV